MKFFEQGLAGIASQPGIEPASPALEAKVLSTDWTAREVPGVSS